MDVLDQLNWRYAVKEFDKSGKLTEGQKELVHETLRLSASSFGLQPWHFVFVQNPELRATLKSASWNQGQVVDASELLVLCRPEKVDEADVDRFVNFMASERGVPADALAGYGKVVKGFLNNFSSEQIAHWCEKQIYLALGSLMAVCAIESIDCCPMEGFDAVKYDEILELPAKGLRSVVVCTLGYRSETDKYATMKKVRYAREEVITII